MCWKASEGRSWSVDQMSWRGFLRSDPCQIGACARKPGGLLWPRRMSSYVSSSEWSVVMPHRLGRGGFYLFAMAIVGGIFAFGRGMNSWPGLLVVLAITVVLLFRTAQLRVELRGEVFLCHRLLPTRKIEFADLLRLEIDGSPRRHRITRVVAVLREGGRIPITYDQAFFQPHADYAEFTLRVNDRIREAQGLGARRY